MTVIELKIQDQVSYLTFVAEDEKRPCTLDHKVLDQFDSCIDEILANIDQIKAVVLQSRFDKYFVVGANIKALQQLSPDNIGEWVAKGHRIFNRLQAVPVPVIARIDGYALGGGLELAMACDIIVASSKAKFGQPEATLGVVPGWGGSYRLPALVGLAKAKELFFTAKIISAAEAQAIGLVGTVAAPEEIDSVLTQMLEAIKKNDTRALGCIKQIVNSQANMGLVRNCGDEAMASVICLHSPTTKQRLADFFNGRK